MGARVARDAAAGDLPRQHLLPTLVPRPRTPRAGLWPGQRRRARRRPFAATAAVCCNAADDCGRRPRSRPSAAISSGRPIRRRDSKSATACAQRTSTPRPIPACRATPATRRASSRRSAAATSIPTPPRSKSMTKARNGSIRWSLPASELWGEDADPAIKVSIEAFEPYLTAGVSALDHNDLARAALEVPAVPQGEDGPVFREPWEAQAFAMALSLHRHGLFTWPEWAATLADEIKRAQAARRPRHRRDLLPSLAQRAGAARRREGGRRRRHPHPLPRRLGARRRRHAARRPDRAEAGAFRP